jgi:DNA-binding NarL/FixJ family response regulator
MLRGKYAVRAAVVEKHANQITQIVGFGFAAFVRKEFVEAELGNPRPGLTSRLIEAIITRRDPLASLNEIRAANTRGDLQQIVLDVSWNDDMLTPLERDDVRTMLGMAYAELFAGFRIARVISEIVDVMDAYHAKSFSDTTIIDRFENLRAENPAWNPEWALCITTLDSIRAHPGSIAAGVVQQYLVPRLGFTQGEKDLLEAATDGLDDLSASSELGLTLSAIKKRWSSIFQRVAVRMPDLCPSDSSDTRGQQKRNRILTYVRQHPEELRPFDEATTT